MSNKIEEPETEPDILEYPRQTKQKRTENHALHVFPRENTIRRRQIQHSDGVNDAKCCCVCGGDALYLIRLQYSRSKTPQSRGSV